MGELRGGMDASQYKDYVLVLLFLKYISDKYAGLLGDTYEYLMRHFATESGKSKGQFYTPAEVNRIMAKFIGIHYRPTSSNTTVYDPTCGFGSLLLKVGDEAGTQVTLNGQEKDSATSGLARMNMIMHNNPTALIKQGNTLADPNLFYRTSIPACIIVVDKTEAAERRGIFMVDASDGFIKDGPKNRLRAQDIHRILDAFNKQTIHELSENLLEHYRGKPYRILQKMPPMPWKTYMLDFYPHILL